MRRLFHILGGLCFPFMALFLPRGIWFWLLLSATVIILALPLNDNLSIPLLAGAAMTLAAKTF